jgi:hypothetical protein
LVFLTACSTLSIPSVESTVDPIRDSPSSGPARGVNAPRTTPLHAWTDDELSVVDAQRLAIHVLHNATRTVEPGSPAPLQCANHNLNQSTPRQHRRADAPAPQTDVLLVGSSTLAWALRPSIEDAAATLGWTLHNSARPSTSLARPDYYDWPGNLPRTLERHQPAVVVMQFGGNDCQALRFPDGGTLARRSQNARWRVGYGDRILEMIRIARDAGARVLLVDLQSGRQLPYNHCVQELSKLMHQVALASDTPIHSVYDATCDHLRAYREEMFYNGTMRAIRATDGLHLNSTGGAIAGRSLVNRLRQHDLADAPAGGICRTVLSPPFRPAYPLTASAQRQMPVARDGNHATN